MSKTVSLTLNVAQADLPALMALAAKSGVSINTVASKKEKKEKDPDAPKKEPNDWIVFTQRARKALETGGLKPGFAVQQYCSSLKEALPMLSVTDANGKEKQVPNYASISDEEILARFKSWTAPEQSNAAAKRADKISPDLPAPAPAAAEKPKKQWSEAAKASAAEKRALTKAAKVAGAAPATAWGSPNKDEAKPAAAKSPEAKPAEADFTEFANIKIGGKDYLVNCRGDLMDAEYAWVGHYDAKTKKINKSAKKPADLEED